MSRIGDLDLVELNEAFASQSLAVIRELGLDPATGQRQRRRDRDRPSARDERRAPRRRRSCTSCGAAAAATASRRSASASARARPRCSSDRALMRDPGRRSSAQARPGSRSAACSSRPGSSRSCSRAAAATTSSTGSAPASSSRAPPICSTAAGVGRAHASARGSSTTGIELQFAGERHRIPLSELTGGRSIVIYGQTEVVKDLIAARLEAALPLLFEVDDVARPRLDTDRPRVRFTHDGAAHELDCDVDRRLRRLSRRLPAGDPGQVLRTSSATTPSAGSGSSPPSPRRTTSSSTRTTSAASRCSACARPSSRRLYLQCRPDEDIAEWPDERIWAELQRTRSALDGWTLAEGPIARERRHGHAQLRRRADAATGASPRRRRRAHRPADRRQGPEPRDRRRQGPRRGAHRPGSQSGDGTGLDAYSTSACAGSGAPSTSPGG